MQTDIQLLCMLGFAWEQSVFAAVVPSRELGAFWHARNIGEISAFHHHPRKAVNPSRGRTGIHYSLTIG
jgi:DNA repair protein RadC